MMIPTRLLQQQPFNRKTYTIVNHMSYKILKNITIGYIYQEL
jgi:hypothetical protein